MTASILAPLFFLFFLSNALGNPTEDKTNRSETLQTLTACPAFSCNDESLEPVPQWPLNYTSVGCTRIGEIQINHTHSDLHHCCDLRWACLQTCGADKIQCDRRLGQCARNTCTKLQDPNDKKHCRRMISKIGKAVLEDKNCTPFTKEQMRRCQCVRKETQAMARREDILRQFTHKFDTTARDRIPILLEMTQTKEQFVKLLLGLVELYPKSIQRTLPPKPNPSTEL